MRTIAASLLCLGLLATMAAAHGSCYRGPSSGEIPPNMRVPEDPPPPGCPSGPWRIWWGLNKEEILFPRSSPEIEAGQSASFGISCPPTELESRRDEDVRKRVVPALAELFDAKIGDPDRARVLVAVGALGASHGPLPDRVTERMIGLLTDEKGPLIVRMSAAFALGLGQDAREPIVEALCDAVSADAYPPEVRGCAALALGLLRDAHERGDRVSRLLTHAAESSTKGDLHLCARLAMGLSRDSRFLPPLLACAQSSDIDDRIRASAIAAIGKIAESRPETVDSKLVATLLGAASAEGMTHTVRTALIAMGQVGRSPGLAPALRAEITRALLDATGSEDESASAFALISLGRIGGATPDEASRKNILAAVGRALRSDRAAVRPFAALSLGLVAHGAALSEEERATIRGSLRDAIAKGDRSMGDLGAVPLSLAMLGDPDDAPLLAGILGDQNAAVDLRAACSVGLGMIGAAEWRPVLLPPLEQNGNPTLLIESAIGAGLLGSRTAAPSLLRSLRSTKWCLPQKCWVLRALGKLGDARALGPLIAVTGDQAWSGAHRATAAIAIADLFDRADRLVLTDLTRDLDHTLEVKTLVRLFSIM